MNATRIVTVAPSAATIIDAMNAADRLVGATTHYDGDEENINRIGGWLNPDYERIDSLEPDIVLANDSLQEDVVTELRQRGYTVHHTTPQTLDEVLESFRDIGEAVGLSERGNRLAMECSNRIEAVKSKVAERDRPTVYCEEWSNPPMAAGNWVPHAVEAAGGEYPFVEPGERSVEVDGSVVEDAGPDHVVLHICGHGAKADPATIRERNWDIDANIHVVDDNLLNQPSPLLFDGVETLAKLLHPDAFD